MNETFKAGDLVEVISADPDSPVKVGDRGTVVGPSIIRGYICVDFAHNEYIVASRTDCIRKIPPPQDWVKLCNLRSNEDVVTS